MSFTKTLNQLMKENSTSASALGRAIGVADVTVGKWLKGEAVPNLNNAIEVAKFYNVSLDELSGIDQKFESHFCKLPVLGETSSGLIHIYGLPKGDYVFANSTTLDDYNPAECYCLKYTGDQQNKYLYIHQQKQCEDGDLVVYQQMDSVTASGLSVDMYSIRRFFRSGSDIVLQSLTAKDKSYTFRKQDINFINIQGIVINKDFTTP